MNRNLLKIIAFISMVIDHVGDFLLSGNIVCKIIGRIAFPIFAYFIAEGMKFTKNRKKYFVRLFIFACLAQIPYVFLVKIFKLNILFTFLISIIFIAIIEKFISVDIRKIFLIIFGVCIVLCDVFLFIDYGLTGALIVVLFYFLKRPYNHIFCAFLMILIAFKYFFWKVNILIFILLAIFSLLPLLILFFYKNKNGKLNLKYFFYIGYLMHFILILMVKVIL